MRRIRIPIPELSNPAIQVKLPLWSNQMRFATRKNPSKRDGDPILVDSSGQWGLPIGDLRPSLREIVEDWDSVEAELKLRHQSLSSARPSHAVELKNEDLHSPFPRSFQWADGSAFIQHVKLVRKARNAPLPETLLTVPLMYQGGSDSFLSPTEDIPLRHEKYGMDFEGEFAVVTADVPMGIDPKAALSKIRLILMVNDVSLRGLIPEELAQGFGFFQSKPSSAFGPFAVTPDELGEAWVEGRVCLDLNSEYNGQWFGNPNGREMHFHFGDLIAHAARTRDLAAGTIIGSGTVSNEDTSKGSSCLAEKRMLEQINTGKITTPFMKAGDTIKIWCTDSRGRNLFGTIFQRIVNAKKMEM